MKPTDPQSEALRRAVLCTNACHNLDIPEALPPGILADIVATARAYAQGLRQAVTDLSNTPFSPEAGTVASL